jgi:glycosyltransferase involved in cell wall biosynthesis
MRSRPRILFLSPIEPALGGSGLAMRAGVFLEAMAALGDVELVVLPVAGSPELGERLAARFAARHKVIPVAGRAETHFALVDRIADPAERLEAFRLYGRSSLAAFISIPVLDELRRVAGNGDWDLVHVSRAYLLSALAALADASPSPVTLDLDEDDVLARRRLADLHRLRGEDDRADWQEAEADATEQLIARWLPHVSRMFIASDSEARAFEARTGRPAEVVPNALTMPAISRRDGGGGLLLVASLGYLPNVDGATWLIEDVLPILAELLGATPKVTIVGTGAPAPLVRLCAERHVSLLTDVEDLEPLYARADAAVIPLRAGAGTRLKAIEAAFRSVPIISTKIGVEGLGLGEGEAWLADSAPAFARACHAVLSRPLEARRRAEAARARLGHRMERRYVVRQIAHTVGKLLVDTPVKARGEGSR